jgi:hypothetical protein
MASATSGFFVMIPLGLIMGIAIASSVQVGMVRSLLEEGLREFENAAEVGVIKVEIRMWPDHGQIFEAVSTDTNRIALLEPPIRRVVVDCYVQSFRWGYGELLFFAFVVRKG